MYSQLSPGGCFLRAAKIFSETGQWVFHPFMLSFQGDVDEGADRGLFL